MKNIIKRIMLFIPRRLNNKVKKTNWYKNRFPNIDNYPTNEWYRNHLERNFDVVNVGSSSALYAFNYDGLDVKAFNWALQPQSMDYSFKILKNYFSILRPKGIILIPFCPFSSLSVTGKWTESACDKYFYVLDSTLIDDYRNVAKRCSSPLRYYPKESLKRLLKDVPRKLEKKCHVCHSQSEFEADAVRWLDGWKREFAIDDLDSPLSLENISGSNERRKIIQSMVSFCLERDLRPVFVFPPMHPSLADKLTATFRKNYIYDFIESLNVPNLPFLDYIDVKEFQKDEYFNNSFFMNDKGAKFFTRRVLSDLNVIR